MDDHCVAILACRVQGSRLYGKPLQHLINGGITVLESLIEQIKVAKSVKKIALAISEEKDNWGFIELAKKHSLPYVLGDQHDVLKRIIQAAELLNAKYILRSTSECPFILGDYIDSLFKDFILGDYDRASYEDTPEGTGFELVKTKALVKSHKEGSDKHRSELVTSYIFENQDKFNLLNMKLPEHLRRPEVRLTVDYAEDLIFCQHVYRALNKDGKLINVEDIIKFWDANPELRKPMEIIGIDWGHGRLWE